MIKRNKSEAKPSLSLVPYKYDFWFILFCFSYSSFISFYFMPHVRVTHKLSDDGRFFLFHLNLLYATFDFQMNLFSGFIV